MYYLLKLYGVSEIKEYVMLCTIIVLFFSIDASETDCLAKMVNDSVKGNCKMKKVLIEGILQLRLKYNHIRESLTIIHVCIDGLTYTFPRQAHP